MKYNFIYFVQSLLLILLAPLFQGLLRKLKAFMRGYTGASILQPYYNIIKLFGKGRVRSDKSSFVTALGPLLTLSATVTAALLVPVFYTGAGSSAGNILVIIFILGIVKFFNSLLGLDCGSTFGGMGSSRELFISMLAEPIMFVVASFLYFETKTFNLFDIAAVKLNLEHLNTANIIAGLAFFILILAENARLPVDNPETHLELTMVHEAMVLDLSGSDLAYVEYASCLKLIVFLTIFANCFIPYGIATVLVGAVLLKALLLFILKITVCLIFIAFIEVSMSKFRLFKVPELLAAAFAFSVIAITINYFI